MTRKRQGAIPPARPARAAGEASEVVLSNPHFKFVLIVMGFAFVVCCALLVVAAYLPAGHPGAAKLSDVGERGVYMTLGALIGLACGRGADVTHGRT